MPPQASGEERPTAGQEESLVHVGTCTDFEWIEVEEIKDFQPEHHDPASVDCRDHDQAGANTQAEVDHTGVDNGGTETTGGERSLTKSNVEAYSNEKNEGT